MNSLKIVSLTAENFKRLTAVHIEPNGHLVQITGKNGEGKSSVLDAIWAALGGKDAAPRKPIRNGEQQATIKLDLGEIKVTRKFKAQEDGSYTTSLTVENADGATYKSPQTLLDGLWNSLSIDPLEFAQMGDKEQYTALQQFVPGIDFAKINMEHAADFSRRTDVTRKAKEFRAAAAIIQLPDVIPGERIDEQALIGKLAECSAHNSEIEKRKGAREAARVKAAALQGEAEAHKKSAAHVLSTLEQSINRIKEECERRIQEATSAANTQAADLSASADKKLDEAQNLLTRLAEAPELPAPLDPAEIQKSIASARETNELIERYQKRANLDAQASGLEAEASALTVRMEARQKAKMDAIAAAKMPVDGLGFADGYITLNGSPFEQASDADKLRVSLSIAMAANPKLRIIRAKNGSLLDSDAIKVITKMIEDHDYQLWLERMDESGKVGIVIEDGHVAAMTESAS